MITAAAAVCWKQEANQVAVVAEILQACESLRGIHEGVVKATLAGFLTSSLSDCDATDTVAGTVLALRDLLPAMGSRNMVEQHVVSIKMLTSIDFRSFPRTARLKEDAYEAIE